MLTRDHPECFPQWMNRSIVRFPLLIQAVQVPTDHPQEPMQYGGFKNGIENVALTIITRLGKVATLFREKPV